MVLERRRDRGERVPALDTEPVLEGGLELYWHAFSALSRRRPWGRMPQAIPIAEIVAYCEGHGLKDREGMIRLVTALDDRYLEHARSKLAQATAKAAAGAGHRGR